MNVDINGSIKKLKSICVGQDNKIVKIYDDLSFGQDSDGNWGYIIPGSDTVTPFGSGGGNTSQVYIDRVELVDDGSNLLVECDSIVGDYKSWAVNFPQPESNMFYMFHFAVHCQKESTITFYVRGYNGMDLRLFIDNEGTPYYSGGTLLSLNGYDASINIPTTSKITNPIITSASCSISAGTHLVNISYKLSAGYNNINDTQGMPKICFAPIVSI